MTLNSIIDEKRKRLVRDARERGDGTVFAKKKEMTSPMVEPVSGIDWSKLDLSKVHTLVNAKPGVSVWEAVARADEKGKIIIPNSVQDRIRIETELWIKFEEESSYPVWTGTAIIFEAPFRAFGDYVAYEWMDDDRTRYSMGFQVPGRFVGKMNCALVIEHPDFEFIPLSENDYELRAKHGDAISLLEDIATEERGFYRFDQRFRIPVGEKLDLGIDERDEETRELMRERNSYVGLVARGAGTSLADFPHAGFAVHIIDRQVYESLKRGGTP